MPTTNPLDRYFADAPKERIGESLMNRFLQEVSIKSDLAAMYATAYAHYYGRDVGRGVTSTITRGGDVGELSQVRVNDVRPLARSLLSILTSQKFNWRPQAANNNTSTKAATILSRSLLEWHMKKKGVAQLAANMGEQGIVFSEGFLLSLWDESAGPLRAYDPDTKAPIHEGDLAIHNPMPWDVVRDSQAKANADLKWYGVRLWLNKWDLIALHPKDILGEDTRQAILGAAQDDSVRALTPLLSDKTHELDRVPAWYFFHETSPALPMGCEAIVVSSKCVLRHRPLKYRRTPLTRFGINEMFGTPFAYTPWWDTLGPQELSDALQSAIASNQLTFATQSIAMEQGTDTPPENAFGLKVWEYPKGGKMPEAMNLTSTPPEVFNHLKSLKQDKQSMLNLNDVQRGQPDTAQMNAQAFMVLASKAVEQNTPEQSGFLGAVSRLGTDVLHISADRITVPRKVQITGKDSGYMYTEKEFKGADLKTIESVYVEIGNPLEQTAAGRYQLATTHHEMGLIKDVNDLQQVLDTGRLEPAIQDVRDESNNIAAENEKLSAGEAALCHPFHNHLRHAPKHAALTSNPEVLGNPKALQAVQAHVLEHYSEFFMLPEGMDPMMDPQYPIRIRMLLGQPPPPDMVPPPPPGAVDETGAPTPGDPSMAAPPVGGEPVGAPPGVPPGAPPAMPEGQENQLPI